LTSAQAALKAALDSAKRSDRFVLYHHLRFLAARTAPTWAWGLILGGFSAIVLSLILIFIFGAGLGPICVGILFAYGAFGGASIWFLRSSEGEDAGNVIDVRTEELRLAGIRKSAAIESVRQKTIDVEKATQVCLSLREVIQSEAYKYQVAMNQLLSIDPGRLYPDEFERFVSAIFKHLGFSVETTGNVGDEGVDVVACRGSMRIAIQAKRYISAVGNSAVQQVYAGMTFYRCHRCVVVTNSHFTPSAAALAESTGCLLIGGDKIGPLIRGEVMF
jgi:hypothetical protein